VYAVWKLLSNNSLRKVHTASSSALLDPRRQYQCWTSNAVVRCIVLLTMDILMPETFSAKEHSINFIWVASSWFFSSFYDARLHEHQWSPDSANCKLCLVDRRYPVRASASIYFVTSFGRVVGYCLNCATDTTTNIHWTTTVSHFLCSCSTGRWSEAVTLSLLMSYTYRASSKARHLTSYIYIWTRFLLGSLLLEPWKANKYTNYSLSLLIMYDNSYMFRHYIAIIKERS
jgi:hypothetical protein